MAYDSSEMRLMGGVPGQQLFLYRSADAVASVGASGYFDQAVAEYNLGAGDVIIAVCGLGGTMTVDLLAAEVDGSTVSVVNGT